MSSLGSSPEAAVPSSSIEQALREALRQVHAALLSGDVICAARAMRDSVRLCEEARASAAPVSDEGVFELQSLFDACLEANRRIGRALEARLTAGGRGTAALQAYGRRLSASRQG